MQKHSCSERQIIACLQERFIGADRCPGDGECCSNSGSWKHEWFAYIFCSWRERSRLPNGHTVRMVVPKNGFPHCAGNSKVCCKCIYARLPFPSITVPCMSIRHDRDFKTRLGNDRKNTYRRNIEVKLWKGDVGHWLTLFSSTYLSLDWYIRSVFPVPMTCYSPFGTQKAPMCTFLI